MAAAAPAAPAKTFGSKTCASKSNAHAKIEVMAINATSCGLAMSAARRLQALRWGNSPARIRATSPVTHKTYTLRFDNEDRDSDYYSVVYVGANDICVQVQIRYR